MADKLTEHRSDGLLRTRLRRAGCGSRPDAVPAMIARACAFVGLLDVLAGVFTGFRRSGVHAIAEVLPGALGPFAAALSLSAGLLLLLLAHGLRRRKRREYRGRPSVEIVQSAMVTSSP